MKLKSLLICAFVAWCAFGTNAKEDKNVPIFVDKELNKHRPRKPSANPLPMCVYADGLLTVSFPHPEGEADVVITHSDYSEEYSVSTDNVILIYTDLAVGDKVEISTEEDNCYVAVRYE